MKREFGLIFIILMALFLRLWISDFNPMILDFDPFYHARISEHIGETHFIPSWDEKEMGGIPHYYPPVYHIWIAAVRYITGMDTIWVGSFLTVYFGVLSVLFVYLIGRKINPWVALGAAILFASTPIIVFRTGLWARPTGLTIFLMIALVYSYLRLYRKQNVKNSIVAAIFTITYVFSHSTVLLGIALVSISAFLTKSRGYIKSTFLLIFLSLSIGFLYFYKFIPYLNFSLGYTTEYLPLSTLNFKPDFWFLLEKFLFLSTFNLTFSPLIIHGCYVLRKKNILIATLASLSFLLVIKGNMYILLIFTASIAVGASLYELSKKTYKKKIKYGWSLAILIFLGLFCLNLGLNYVIHGKKVDSYVKPLEEVLTVPLTDKDTILANDLNIGHEIPYYTNASVFITVLSDTKRWSENYKTYRDLYNMTGDEVPDILSKNGITHLLLIQHSGKEIFPFVGELELETISEVGDENMNITLYKIKK